MFVERTPGYTKFRKIGRCVVTALPLLLIAWDCRAEIYTWVDATGKTHFGESAPPEYAAQAKIVEQTPINTPAPEPEIRLKNQRAAEDLRQRDALRRAKAQHSKHTRNNDTQPDVARTPTREWCRDNFNKVKERTECFLRASP